MKKYIILTALLWAGSAHAQIGGGVTSTGAITPGNCVSWASANVIQDAGAACGGSGGGGTVTSVSVTTTGGVSGTVATATTTPAISLSLGAITPTSVNGLTLSATTTGALSSNGAGVISSGTLAASNGGTGATSLGSNLAVSSGVLNTTELINAQTGTSYTVVAADMGKTVTSTNAAATAITLPQAGTAGFTTGTSYSHINLGAGVVTITPSGSTINGAATLVLTTKQGAYIISDGTNWVAFLGGSAPGSGTSTAASFTPTSSTAPTNGMYLSAANTVGFAGNSVKLAEFTNVSGVGVLQLFGGHQINMNSNTASPYALNFYDATDVSTMLSISSSGQTIFGRRAAGQFSTNVTGAPNTIIGAGVASTTLTTGTNNILLGVSSAIDSAASSTSNTINIGGTGGSWVLVTGTNTNSTEATTMRGSLTLTDIASDATHTDSAICQDTTTHTLYSGSGTLGACLGTSSARYKTDIKPLLEGVEEINELKPISFYYKKGHGDNGAKLQYGFLAEDMVSVLPKLVDLDKEGKPNSVDMLGLVPVLVQALQEQQKEIDDLKKEIVNK